MYDIWDEHIKLPANVAEFDSITCYYEFAGLPGCIGSMDVLHIKWNNCLTRDHNRAKGKEGYSSLGFQCITNYNCCILGIFGLMFGAWNDKEIVKLDPNVKKICCGWFSRIWWQYYLESGQMHVEKDVYLICNNGYLQWPEAICPYSAGEPIYTLKGSK
jgi:hypothetical protein